MFAMHAATALHEVEERILTELHQHRLLTTQQLHELVAPERDASVTRRMLERLRDHRGMAACVHPRWQYRKPTRTLVWYATPTGTRVAESVEPPGRRKQMTEELACGPLQQHTLAVNDVGLAFLRAARERGDEVWWEHERPIVKIAAPRRGLSKDVTLCDGLLTYRYADGTLRQRFIEVDRSTTRVDQLTAKLLDYHGVRDEWIGLHETDPEVLVVFAGDEKKRLRRRMRKTTETYYGETTNWYWKPRSEWADPNEPEEEPHRSDMPLRFVTLEELLEHGPWSERFSRLHGELAWTDWLGAERASTVPAPDHPGEGCVPGPGGGPDPGSEMTRA